MALTGLAEKIDGGMPVLDLFGSTGMPKLTVNELRRASTDLIEASHRLAESGHHKGELIDKHTGAVCILGALEAVTYKKVGRVARDYALLTVDTEQLDSCIYRCVNACIVLSATVGHLCECERSGGPMDTVTHYNDVHCVGGIVAYNMLRIAAVRALVLAESKHDYIEKVLN